MDLYLFITVCIFVMKKLLAKAQKEPAVSEEDENN